MVAFVMYGGQEGEQVYYESSVVLMHCIYFKQLVKIHCGRYCLTSGSGYISWYVNYRYVYMFMSYKLSRSHSSLYFICDWYVHLSPSLKVEST